MNYTPGPWKVSKEKTENWALVTTAHGNIIANVNGETGPDLPPLVSIKMPMEANALLISLAPDLLGALKKCVIELKEDLSAWGDCDHSVGVCYCSIKNAISDTETLIQKLE